MKAILNEPLKRTFSYFQVLSFRQRKEKKETPKGLKGVSLIRLFFCRSACWNGGRWSRYTGRGSRRGGRSRRCCGWRDRGRRGRGLRGCRGRSTSAGYNLGGTCGCGWAACQEKTSEREENEFCTFFHRWASEKCFPYAQLTLSYFFYWKTLRNL